MLRELRLHVLQGEGRANLYALGPANSVFLTKVTHKGMVMLRRIEARDLRRTGLQTLRALGPQTPVLVHNHVKFLSVIMDHRRIDRAGLFTLPLLVRALAAEVLYGFRSRQKVTVDANSRKLPVDRPIMEHGARNLAVATADAEIPSRLDQGFSFGKGKILYSPSLLVLQGPDVF